MRALPPHATGISNPGAVRGHPASRRAGACARAGAAVSAFLRPTGRRRGFTLLEVMVSLGILAVALLAIGDINGGAVRMHAYSKKLSVAVQLARGKMLDLQAQLRKDGLSDFSKEYTGDFEDEHEPEYKWVAQVVKPELEVDPAQLMGLIQGGLGMASPEGGPQAPQDANPLAALGPLGGMVDQQVKAMTETLKNSVREVRLTVKWKNGAQEEEFSLAEHVIILPNAAAAAAANAAPIQPGQGGAGAPPAVPGLPGTDAKGSFPQGQPRFGIPPGTQFPGGLPSPFGGGSKR